MAFFGYYVIARSDRPVNELASVRTVLEVDVAGAGLGTLEGRYVDGGWQLAVIYQGWGLHARDVAEETTAPAMAIYVIESAVGLIDAATADGRSWQRCLNPADAIRAFDIPHAEAGDAIETTRLATAWAGAAGLTADPGAVAAAVDQYVGPFGQGVDAFLKGLGFHFQQPAREETAADRR